MQVPNSNDFGDPTKVLHHTTAEENFNQEHRCFQEVTCCQVLTLPLSHHFHYVHTYSRPASGHPCIPLQPPQPLPAYCLHLCSSVTAFQTCPPEDACCPMDLQTTIRAILHTCNPNNHCHSVMFDCAHQSQHSNPYFLTVYGLTDHHQGHLRRI